MSLIRIEGGHRLNGELTIQGAKNSVLPILAATLLCGDCCLLRHCPRLSDVDTAVEILRHLGCRARWLGEDLEVDTGGLCRWDIPDALMRRMRSSVIFFGAILARCGRAELSYPGGCAIGARPIDLHLSALRGLGANIREEGGRLYADGSLSAAELVLGFPSVGATENAILAACAARGVTVISNAAREPEICDLQAFLQKMGAKVRGAGSSTITVEGGAALHGCQHRVMGDRIVAATYLSAVAATGGDIHLKGVDYRCLSTVTGALRQAGCTVESSESGVRLRSQGRLQGIGPVRTAPYPGFPTDAQAPLMASLLRSSGTTVFVENMFESRYRHVPELLRMGADIRLEGRVAVVCGVKELQGAALQAADLRGGAALVLAGLQARGQSTVEQLQHVRRGYESLVDDLARLGAAIETEDTEGGASNESDTQTQTQSPTPQTGTICGAI